MSYDDRREKLKANLIAGMSRSEAARAAGEVIDITPPREIAAPMPEPVAVLAPVNEDPSSTLPAFLFRRPYK